MLYTKGFVDDITLGEKFDKHVIVQREFPGVTTEFEYLELADTFCGGTIDSDTEECIRSYDGARLRYNKITNEFGIVGSDGFIRTYYKPTAGERYFRRNCV